MKIALTGPSGSGKTTISAYIQHVTGLPYVSMSAGDILDTDQKYFLKDQFGYDNKGHKNVIQLSNTNPKFGKMFQSLVRHQRAKVILEKPHFIIDRCPIDNLAYFLLQVSPNATDQEVEEFIYHCKETIKEIDIIIFCHSKAEEIENNNSRVDNKYYQRMTERVFLYAAELLGVTERVYHLDTWNIEDKEVLIRSILAQEGITINNNKR
jgi:GTPase SAR1 family protein